MPPVARSVNALERDAGCGELSRSPATNCRVAFPESCPHAALVRALAIVIGLVALLAAGGALLGSGSTSTPPGAKALEASLLAPCCFGGTLDVHDSEISHQLRAEIEARVARGESTAAIESDLVSRYGPQIRAMPDRGAFSATMAMVMVSIGIGGAAVLLLARRWRRGAPALPSGDAGSPALRDADDERLDAELAELD